VTHRRPRGAICAATDEDGSGVARDLRVQTFPTCSRRRLRRRAALCLMQPQTLARGMRPAGRSPRGVRLRRASRSTPLPSPIRHSTTQLRRSARERGSNRGMHASGGRAPPGPGTARRSGEGHEGGDLLPAPRGQPDRARPAGTRAARRYPPVDPQVRALTTIAPQTPLQSRSYKSGDLAAPTVLPSSSASSSSSDVSGTSSRGASPPSSGRIKAECPGDVEYVLRGHRGRTRARLACRLDVPTAVHVAGALRSGSSG
jgi:hypothetical protein